MNILEATTITLTLVNLHPAETREVIVQAGAFGEHAFTRVRNEEGAHQINDNHLRVRLGKGAVGTLEIGMQRYVNRPSYERPWE